MSDSIKIRVGLPSYSGKLFPETWKTVKALSDYSNGAEFDVNIVAQCYTSAQGRNVALSGPNRKKKQSFDLDFDYFLSMDADMSFDVSAVLMLIDRDKDIISAAYRTRNSGESRLTSRFCAAIWETPGLIYPNEFLPDTTLGLKKVSFVGLGCCLIKSRVLESMEYPYFRNNVVDLGDESSLASDDVSFCMDAAKNGFKIYLDSDIRVDHISGNEDR